TQQRRFARGYAHRGLRLLLGDGLLTSEGEFHRRQRRIAQPAFHRERIAEYARAMTAAAMRWSDRWEALPRRQRVRPPAVDDAAARADLLSMLLLATDPEEQGGGAEGDAAGAPMSDVQLRDEVMTLFLAGHETTANALAWTWFLLAQHPDVEARLHAELAAVL